MFYSRLLYCMVWVLGICLLVTGAFGPMFGMNLAVAHYMLLAAISLYGFKKFIMWLNRPYYAAARLDENHTLQPIKARQLLMLPFAAWFAFFPCTLVASPLPVGPATDWGKITAKDGRVVPFSEHSKLLRIEYIPTHLQNNAMIMVYIFQGDISLKQMISERKLAGDSFVGNSHRIGGSTVFEQVQKGHKNFAQAISKVSLTYTDVTTIKRMDLGNQSLVVFKKERLEKGNSKPIFEASMAIPVEINQWIAFKLPFQIVPFTEWFFIKYRSPGAPPEESFF